jgi:hypothetical protein
LFHSFDLITALIKIEIKERQTSGEVKGDADNKNQKDTVDPLTRKKSNRINCEVFNQEAFFFSYGIIWGILNASWKICFLVVNGQSFLVLDGYLLNL